jgi:hypothetical protein
MEKWNINPSNTSITMNQLQILQYIIEKHLVADSATINTAFALINQIRAELTKAQENKE